MKPTRYPRPAILDAISIHKHAVIEASAGTGKTFTLEHLLVELLLRGDVTLDQVVVVTYTDKATREMRARVRRTLQAIVDDEADPRRDTAHGYWDIDTEDRRKLEAALRAYDHAPISTMHAFCQRILSEHAFDHGRLLAQEQVDARRSFGSAFRQELREALAPGAPLRPALHALLQEENAETLEQRMYAWAQERGELRPHLSINGLAEVVRRLRPLKEASGLFASIRGGPKKGPVADRLQDILERLLATADRFRSSGDMEELLKALFAARKVDTTKGMTAAAYVEQYLAAALERSPAHRLVVEDVLYVFRGAQPLVLLAQELLPAVKRRQREHKERAGLFDFDDMLTVVRDGLTTGPNAALLVEELRRRHRYALVDEFQDTDEVQWDIFRTLFVDGAGPHRLFVIGDPKQAIFAFRNADVHTYYGARDALIAAGGALVPLTVNRRSTARVVDAGNRIIASGLFDGGSNRYDHPVTCGQPEWDALDAEGNSAPAVTLVRLGASDPKVRAERIRQAMARFVAAEIDGLLHAEPAPLRIRNDKETRRVVAGDIHVLVGSAAEGNEVAVALRERAIPCSFFKQEGLLQTREASDVMDVLRAVERPWDRSRRARAFLSPFFAVPMVSLAAAVDGDAAAGPLGLVLQWKTLAEKQQYARLFDAIIEDSGIVRRELILHGSERELTNYLHIFELLALEARLRHADLGTLLGRLQAFIDERAFPEGENANVQRLETDRLAVQVLTVHKAKGLEAPVVFLAGGFTRAGGADSLGVFHESGHRVAWVGAERPAAIKARVDAERTEEFQRLMYVAITRAAYRLYLPHTGRTRAVATEGRPPLDPQYINGSFTALSPALETLVQRGAIEDPSRMFDVRSVEVDAPVPLPTVDPNRLADIAVPDPVEPDEPDADALESLRRVHSGVQVTNYTRLKRGLDAMGATRAVERGEMTAEVVDADAAPEADVDPLPGGAAVGRFLHEVIELVPWSSIGEEDSAEVWARRDDVWPVANTCAQRNGLGGDVVELGTRLVHHVLRWPVKPGGVELVGGFHALKSRVAEMDFLFPIPETFHAPPPDPDAEPETPPFRAERGFVRGVVDLVFEHAGRTYFLDWKSDRLPDWSAPRVAAHVQSHYRVQAVLYTLGICRLLGVTTEREYEQRFGGLLYCFLRAMRPGSTGTGIFEERPTWADVCRWQDLLRDRPSPWVELLAEQPGGAP